MVGAALWKTENTPLKDTKQGSIGETRPVNVALKINLGNPDRPFSMNYEIPFPAHNSQILIGSSDIGPEIKHMRKEKKIS